jgi:phage gpG-like protein
MRIRAIADTSAVDARLQNAIRKMENMDELLKEFGALGERGAKMAHASESTPGGAAWADLAASTWRQKTSGKKVWERGDLARSFKARPPMGTAIEVASEGVPYAIYHHTGTKKMPQRRSLPMPSWLEPKMTSIAKRHLGRIL